MATMTPRQQQMLMLARARARAGNKEGPKEEKTLSGFGDNVLSSGKQFGSEIANMVMHPIDTLGNVADLAQGGIQKALPDDFTIMGMNPDAGMKRLFGNEEGLADSVGQFYADRYGGAQNVADTAYEDPVGLLSDIAMVFGGGLKTAGSLANKVGGTGNKVAKALNTTGKVADSLDLLNLGVGVGTKAAAKARGGAKYAIDSTQQQAKFSTTLPADQRARMAQTLLENKLDPTNPKSVNKLQELLDKAEESSIKAIERFDADGGMIDAMPAVDNMRRVLDGEKGIFHPEAAGRQQTIEGLISGAEDILRPVQGQLTGRQAIDTRRAVDANVDWRAKGASETASNQSLKAYANGLREQLAESVKGLDGVNKEYSKLVEVAEPLSRSTARNSNNTGGLGKALTLGAGAFSAGTGNLGPLAISIIGNKYLNPSSRQRLAQFVFDRSSKGSRSVSDKALATEIMRVIQEIEQTTGQQNEQ